MKEDRFAIKFDEKGCQLHNTYIEHICKGIIEYNRRRNITVEKPQLLYGMLHTDRKILEIWEKILQEAKIIT